MKRTRITIGTEPNSYIRFNRAIPGLLWAELVTVLDEYKKFENNIKGTRFDPWLKKGNKNG